MKKIIKLSFGSFVVVALLGFIFLISSVENEKESFFSSYDLLGEDGQRYISWVPVFLPKTAFNIRIYADVETNYFYMFLDRKSTRLNSSHLVISYAVFCLKKKNICY